MEYAYYPGCSLHVMSSEYDVSTRAVFAHLGLKLLDVPDWFCCGASAAHMSDAVLGDVLPAKNLALCAKVAKQVAVPCAACFYRLKKVNLKLQHEPLYLKAVNEKIQAAYRGELDVKHPLEIIAEKFPAAALQTLVKKPLRDLKVASYYGCLLVRPQKIAFDDQENPQSLDRLVTALGATALDWPYKVECCGAGMTLANKKTVLHLAGKIIRAAIKLGADCVAVACPMCHVNLDMYQGQLALPREIPILYFTELLGLALGLEYSKMEIDKHLVAAKPLLQNKGLL